MTNLGGRLFMHTVFWMPMLVCGIPLEGELQRIQSRLCVTFEAYGELDTVSFDV